MALCNVKFFKRVYKYSKNDYLHLYFGMGGFTLNLPEIQRDLGGKLEKMTSKQLILLALLASLIITVVIYFYLSGLENKDVQKAHKLKNVVVATVDIPERTMIREEMLKTVQMTEDVVQADAITDFNGAVGKIAKLKILQGDALTEKKLFTEGKMEGFIGAIPADRRAISIPITDITGISGFAKPGDYVDVILVSDKMQKNTVSGEMLLQNILLLAINKNGDVPDGKKDEKKEQMATATLAVAPETAVRLAAAQAHGTIYLVLRPFKPQDNFILTTSFSYHQAGQAATGETAPATAVTPQPAPYYPMQTSYSPLETTRADIPVVKPSHSIAVIRGNSVNTVEVQ